MNKKKTTEKSWRIRVCNPFYRLFFSKDREWILESVDAEIPAPQGRERVEVCFQIEKTGLQ
ncbi:hypothetical protein DPMN_025907 [Dreissena polymorpha]|uniref:Uncharacterized protein n=1 Tax=Dreissena polymorpha TaxID=45954 RepID=A0A9D4LRH9_DREPO|nr:hypothetical protein DPMN_025875 [Dreissena polymorpha]KAH3862932.1 hypothetical protein DPMN_025907 [Dreissena polymorpha]